ncbi:hypothetical protein R1sor_008167 [Riccia sorocarpa]|uniref:MLO-like protein n=1 Tax=Riccia sorocarpa TaxID=122646 RepID=A0ABD3HU92_9MARC
MAGGEATLEYTPTYAVAISAALLIGVSFLVERMIHKFKKHLKKEEVDQIPLKRIADKLTNELMLLGLVSLLLTVVPKHFTEICVSPGYARHMLLCKADDSAGDAPDAAHRRLLASLLDSSDSEPQGDYCQRKGKTSFVSLEGLRQLHILIFVLAVTHVTYSILSVLLGFARMQRWREWEDESRLIADSGQSIKADLERRIIKKLDGERGRTCSFVDGHFRRYKNPVIRWTLCFFQQFVASVGKEDYMLFRVGFISKFGFQENFDFREYITRSMEVDFKTVVGISWWLWTFVAVFFLLSVEGWYTLVWASFIPTILVLIIGTKQQHIISVLALRAKRHALKVRNNQQKDGEKTRTDDTGGSGDSGQVSQEQEETRPRPRDIGHAVMPSNKLFWFQKPKILLKLIHFVIFQNSFELALLFWVLVRFGWNSCLLGHHTLVIIRVTVGAATILLSSYSTIPIYALVNQVICRSMGDNINIEAAPSKSFKIVDRLVKSWVPQKGSSGHQPTVNPTPANEPRTPGSRTGIQDPLEKHFHTLFGKRGGTERLRTHRSSPITSSEVTTNPATSSSRDPAQR